MARNPKCTRQEMKRNKRFVRWLMKIGQVTYTLDDLKRYSDQVFNR